MPWAQAVQAVVQPNNQCAASVTTIVVAIIVFPLLIFTSQEKLVKHMIWDSILCGGVLSLLLFFVLLIVALIVILCIARHSNDRDISQLAACIICLLGFSFALILLYFTIRGACPAVVETEL